ncbi:hypothetical protein FBU30_002285, partial [Linnemannia zychae]
TTTKVRLFEMKLYIVAIATLLSAVHAVEIRGYCNNKLVGVPIKFSMRCTYSKDGEFFQILQQEFPVLPQFPETCGGELCIKKLSSDYRWTEVTFNGQSKTMYDYEAKTRQADIPTDTWYQTANFVFNF